MNMTIEHVNDIVVLSPQGRITLGDGDQELGEAVRQQLEAGSRKILLDFSAVNYLDSSGIGELVGCYTSILNRQGKLVICGLNERIFGLMKMTSLHSVFDVRESREEGLTVL